MKQESKELIAQAKTILKYWHKIEFFQSINIEELENNTNSVLPILKNDLKNQGVSILPWINTQKIESFDKELKYEYTLFLGIFDRAAFSIEAQKCFPEHPEDDGEEWEERLSKEGKSCSIKCCLDDGIVKLENFEFSTAPWALGQLKRGKFDSLEFSSYEEATQNLHQKFRQIISIANNIKTKYNLPELLTPYEIFAFIEAMNEWTDFKPPISEHFPTLFLSFKKIKEKKNPLSKQLLSEFNNSEFLKELGDAILPKSLSKHEPATDASSSDNNTPTSSASNPVDIAILNSFYIRDIEKVLTDIRKNGLNPNSALGKYLIGYCDKKPDLLLPDGYPQLLKNLKLDKLPLGRWPSNTTHNMSLMQQFAINTLKRELEISGLYSVNGPPGTGKTTMLRDIIANNIVERATLLAQLKEAKAAFTEKSLSCNIDRPRKIPCLLPKLCGYEMVISSSNNAAVENISRELPQIKSLGEEWQKSAYLKPVAQKLAASTKDIDKSQQKDGKTYEIHSLEKTDDCWGLIAAALGKSANRKIFKERLLFKKISDAKPRHLANTDAETRPPAATYRNLYDSLQENVSSSFSEAKESFKETENTYNNILEDLKKLETLSEQVLKRPILKVENKQLAEQLKTFNTTLDILTNWQSHIRKKAVWRSLRIKKIHQKKRILIRLQEKYDACREMIGECEKRIQKCQQELDNLDLAEKAITSLENKYPNVRFSSDNTNPEDKDIQKTAFGQCQKLNEVRSQLTVQALKLHEAWLREVWLSGEIKDAIFCISKAIDGSLDKDITLAIWRLLFMITPVVSSTFASIAHQFKNLGANDIGWLFIDEAGQATPQQAVGALWRTKRAVVVGDPLQIEPVFTISPAFVDIITEKIFGKNPSGQISQHWSPIHQSVQSLADRVNPYGTAQIAKNTWLGSPLRVHRRCDEPMFSIANKIAYNDKMIHGGNQSWPQGDFLWEKSRWFDIKGHTDGKHYVPKQGEYILKILKKWLEDNQILPDVYIISPFREIKNRLKSFLKNKLKDINGIEKWVNSNIGTVHTFQGKEEKVVIFVLGLAQDSAGASKWASSKPNLLNVAVTRAKNRIYIIGSKEIWANCQYFDTAIKILDSYNKT